VHLAHYPATVCLHGDHADSQLAADLFVQSAGYDVRHDLSLARTKRRESPSQLLHLRLPIQGGTAALDRAADGGEQNIVAERLGQELDGSRLHRLHRHRDIAVTSDENDRQVSPVAESMLQIEPAEAGQRYIEHQAARTRITTVGQEVQRRGKGLRPPPGVLDQRLEGFPHGDVIVDDENHGCHVRHVTLIGLPSLRR